LETQWQPFTSPTWTEANCLDCVIVNYNHTKKIILTQVDTNTGYMTLTQAG